MATKAISITIDDELAEKLSEIARETHRKKSYFVNRALEEYFEAIEDFELGLERIGGESIDIGSARKELGI